MKDTAEVLVILGPFLVYGYWLLEVVSACFLSPILTFSLPIGAMLTYLANDNTILTPSFKLLEYDNESIWSDLLWTANYMFPFSLGWAWIFLSLVYPIDPFPDDDQIISTLLLVEGEVPWARADAMMLAWFHLPIMWFLLIMSAPTLLVMLLAYYPLLILYDMRVRMAGSG